MHKLIDLITRYCKKYDITINEKKTKWMKIGDPVRENEVGVPIVKPGEPDEIFLDKWDRH